MQAALTPDLLYGLFVREMESEGLDYLRPWDELDAPQQIAWGKLYRTLKREGFLA